MTTMRCLRCKRENTTLVKLIRDGEDPVYVCADDRTCEAIADAQRRSNPKMAKVMKHAARFAS